MLFIKTEMNIIMYAKKNKTIRFSNSLKELMKNHSVKSYSQLASKLEKSASTVSQHVSSLAETRDYNSEFVASLSKVLGIEVEDIRTHLEDADSSSDLDPIAFSEQMMDEARAKQETESYEPNMERFLRTMSEGEEYIFATHQLPWEFENSRFKKVIVEAIKNKANITYMFPDPDDDSFSDLFSTFHGTMKLGWRTLSESYKIFLDVINEEDQVPKDTIKQHLKCYLVKNPFLINPLMKLALFSQELADESTLNSGFIEIPIGLSTSINSYQLWRPMPKAQTEMLSRAMRNIILNQKPLN